MKVLIYENNSKNNINSNDLNLNSNDNLEEKKQKQNEESSYINIKIKSLNLKNKRSNNKCNNYYQNIKIGKFFKIIFCENLIRFYKYQNNLKDKKYMVIACGHIFHSECVEKWFERKKECPNCRAPMKEFL